MQISSQYNAVLCYTFTQCTVKKHNFPRIIDFTEFLCIFQNGQETYNYKKKTSNLWFISGTPAIFLRYFSRHAGNGLDSLGGLVGDIFLRDRNVTVLMKCA